MKSFSLIFLILILVLIDLILFHPKKKKISIQKQGWISFFYFFISILFGIWVGYAFGIPSSLDYFNAYFTEKMLSLDNLFVISMIFSQHAIPIQNQHRVLIFGILGALVFRGLFIWMGIHILEKFHFILYFLSVFLIFSGLKVFQKKTKKSISALKWKFLNIKKRTDRFWIQERNPSTQRKKIYGTSLLLALIQIECMDFIFALDSLPAVFSITQDPLIVYSSNIFAILGLRSLYFFILHMLNRFYFLKNAIGILLIWIGFKIFLVDFLNLRFLSGPSSFLITLLILAGGIFFSLQKKKSKSNLSDPKA